MDGFVLLKEDFPRFLVRGVYLIEIIELVEALNRCVAIFVRPRD